MTRNAKPMASRKPRIRVKKAPETDEPDVDIQTDPFLESSGEEEAVPPEAPEAPVIAPVKTKRPAKVVRCTDTELIDEFEELQKRMVEWNDTKLAMDEIVARIRKKLGIVSPTCKNTVKKRSECGFTKPTYISREMCELLDIPIDKLYVRNEVTKILNAYISRNGLQNPNDKRHIIPNDTLHKIFKSNPDNRITIFNIQSYIKHHFIKEPPGLEKPMESA
jgi:hypothetical protein